MSDLKEKVAQWIATQGYPLEFAAAATFRSRGFLTRQGLYLRDPTTSIPREVDVLAWLERREVDAVFDIAAVVECKWSKDKPWVFFLSDRGDSPLPALKKPKDLLEYVVVHELLHLITPKHNEQFISLLSKHYPSWREARAELNELPLGAESWRE